MNAIEPHGDDAVELAASEWLARCDRVLTGPEEETFLGWLSLDPRNGETLLHLARCWAMLDRLRQGAPKTLPGCDRES